MYRADFLESRSLNVRCGFKKSEGGKVGFVHMLNGTLCATERALCCLVENYQTPEVSSLPLLSTKLTLQGLRIPEVLRPYMQGRDFIPYTAELPKSSTSNKKK